MEHFIGACCLAVTYLAYPLPPLTSVQRTANAFCTQFNLFFFSFQIFLLCEQSAGDGDGDRYGD